MHTRFTKRAALRLLASLAFALTATIAIASVATGASAPKKTTFTATDLSSAATDTISVSKSESGRLAQTDPSLLGRSDSTPVNVMIKYDYDATASYTGGVAGLAATSPRATGKALKDNKARSPRLRRARRRKSPTRSSPRDQAGGAGREDRDGLHDRVRRRAAQVPANKVAALLAVDGVAAVQKDTLKQPLDDNTDFIGAKAVWPSLGGSSKRRRRT